jgi:hypothetical protein
MKVSPFAKVGNVPFGISPDALIELLGPPNDQRTDNSSNSELDYGSAVYRFDATSTLVEVTADVPALELGDAVIPFPFLAAYVREHDQSAFERAGFLVSPSFGLAHDPDYPSWVTVFPQQSVSLWQASGKGTAAA